MAGKSPRRISNGRENEVRLMIKEEFNKQENPNFENNNELLETVKLANEREYLILDRIMYDGSFYVLLVSDDDENETFIQKEVMKDNQLSFQPLETETEFQEVLKRFSQKDISP